MGKRERLFLWLVLILAASLVLAVLSWLADELGWGGGGSTGLLDVVLTVALITMLASTALLAIIGPSVFRSRLTPPGDTLRRR
jgi:hypothetical protein